VLSNIASPGSPTTAPVDVAGWLVQIGGDDIATRVDVFEQIFLVFMLLGTLVGVVVITYTLYNAYHYRSGNENADETKDRPRLGELPTGANKGGRKLFLSFGLSAIIVVSLIAWTYGMLLFVEGGGGEFADENTTQVEVVGSYPNWQYEYTDNDTVPNSAATQLVIAARDDNFTTITSVEEIENRDLHTLIDEVLAEAQEMEDEDRSPSEDFDTFGLQTRNVGASGTLRVPANEKISLNVTGKNRWHNFGIPAQNVKSDAIPGHYSDTWFVAEEPGTYRIECFELCGAKHSEMTGTLIVNESDTFDSWYNERTASASEIAGNPDQFYDPEPADESGNQSARSMGDGLSTGDRSVSTEHAGPTDEDRSALAVIGARLTAQ
jgi:cytochrome c oxidase subunit 2